ncbi:hypothetical protein WA158_002280 [Blastocystis sp. Blastoise]
MQETKDLKQKIRHSLDVSFDEFQQFFPKKYWETDEIKNLYKDQKIQLKERYQLCCKLVDSIENKYKSQCFNIQSNDIPIDESIEIMKTAIEYISKTNNEMNNEVNKIRDHLQLLYKKTKKSLKYTLSESKFNTIQNKINQLKQQIENQA